MSVPTTNETCRLEHPVFEHLGDVVFRPAEADGTPVMIRAFGKTSGALPLRSLQAELGIVGGMPDHRMFGLIARALDFVPEVRLGDKLPVEVLDGEASWQPSVVHQQVAAARLRLRLVVVTEGAGADWSLAELQPVLAAIDAPGMPVRLERMYAAVAATLGLPDPAAALRLIDAASKDLGFVESLRDRLLRRVVRVRNQVDALMPSLAQNLSAIELVSRVSRLSKIGIGKIQSRFGALDSCMQDLPIVLTELEVHRVSIRLHRDWLYCSLRAWEPILSAWEAAGPQWNDSTLALLGRTYRFLAQRFTPAQEWQLSRNRRVELNDRTRMVW